jgi:DNA-binding transcriptional MerR regulator
VRGLRSVSRQYLTLSYFPDILLSGSFGNVQNGRDGWTLAGLAAESGVPARTIRFYIARGLLAAPAIAGRGAFYGQEHLERLREIRGLQAKGLSLAQIGLLRDSCGVRRLSEPESWWHYRVSADVTVSLRAGMGPWRLRQVRAWMEKLAGELEKDAPEETGAAEGEQNGD